MPSRKVFLILTVSGGYPQVLGNLPRTDFKKMHVVVLQLSYANKWTDNGKASGRVLSACILITNAPEVVINDKFWVFERGAETKFGNRRKEDVEINFNNAAVCASHCP
jgi:hypothetical protein